MLALGPAWGMFVNALFYLPLLLWLWKAPYGPRFRKEQRRARARGARLRRHRARRCARSRGNRTIVSMTLLAGGASLFVGNAYQAQMPEFAHDLGHGDAGRRLQHAARRRRGRRAGRRPRAREPRPAAAAAAHRLHPGDALVLRDRRLRPRDAATRSRWCCCSSPASSSWRSPRWRRRWCRLNAPRGDPRPRDRPLQHVRARACAPSAASPSASSAA